MDSGDLPGLDDTACPGGGCLIGSQFEKPSMDSRPSPMGPKAFRNNLVLLLTSQSSNRMSEDVRRYHWGNQTAFL